MFLIHSVVNSFLPMALENFRFFDAGLLYAESTSSMNKDNTWLLS